MRNEQVAGFGERIEALCSPGAQEGRQSHLAVGSLFGSSAAADLAADHQMPQTPFRSVVLRRHVWMRYEDEQLLDEPLYTPAELDLGRRIVVGERGDTARAIASPASTGRETPSVGSRAAVDRLLQHTS